LDSQTILASLLALIAGLAFVDRLLNKSLSIREHDEYRSGMTRTTDGIQDAYRREIDRLENRLLIIEQTRPTAGELQQVSTSLKEQIVELKLNLRAK
jgi:hypothetical protein